MCIRLLLMIHCWRGRSVCHVGGDGVVLEDGREDVTPRRDV